MRQKFNAGGREHTSQPDVRFKICKLGPNSALFFLPKTTLKCAENGQVKGN